MVGQQYSFPGRRVRFSIFRSLLAVVGALAVSSSVRGQSPTSFEIVSIRRNLNGGLNTQINTSGERFTVSNGSVKTLIRNAYDVLSFQLNGGPRWLDTDMYDIVATTGVNETISPEQLKLLLRNLLADRFQLKVHWETREATVYALVLDKNGRKFKEGSDGEKPGINTRKGPGEAQMRGTNQPISILASNLGNQLGRFVLDKTGLAGLYDWLLVWDPDPAPDSTNPSILTAVQQQLGLKLESQKGPMEMLVIDSAEKASEN
jgi:uncharacterized protein (TIGR03435 family)